MKKRNTTYTDTPYSDKMNKELILQLKLPVIASFSGGKDSTAMCLYLLYESGIPKEQIHIVFVDTKWEHPYTYDVIERMNKLHHVDIITSDTYDGMTGLMCNKGIPTQIHRFCTYELKIVPINPYLKQFNNPICTVGFRKEEGTKNNKRGTVEDFMLDTRDDVIKWYPIKDFSIEDVWDIHKKYNFERNKLYDLGFSRVGCFPCIFANKKELCLISKMQEAQERIDEIRKAEQQRNFPFISPTGKKKFHNRVTNNGKPYADIDAIMVWCNTSTADIRKMKKGS